MVINAVTLHGSRALMIANSTDFMIRTLDNDIQCPIYMGAFFSEFYCIYMTGSCTLLN